MLWMADHSLTNVSRLMKGSNIQDELRGGMLVLPLSISRTFSVRFNEVLEVVVSVVLEVVVAVFDVEYVITPRECLNVFSRCITEGLVRDDIWSTVQ